MLMDPGRSTSADDGVREDAHSARHVLPVMKRNGDHTVTCLTIHIRQGLTSNLVACHDHANMTAMARISPRSSSSLKQMCPMSPRKTLSCQKQFKRL